MPVPAGRPVVDVTQFATLAKLAERYGLLVLHWCRSGVETFVVQDEGITYRYRASTSPSSEALTVTSPDGATERVMAAHQ
jgi:VCBS repeat-containing protein